MARSALEPLRIPDDLWQRDDVGEALDGRDIGRIFQLLHKYAGASQTRIGIAVGMAQGTISLYMNGTRVVTAIDVLERVADGLAMPDEARARLGLAPPHGSLILTATAAGDDDELEAVELGGSTHLTGLVLWPGYPESLPVGDVV
jgi:transcriptional regulator with XRE-family HTH domain